MKKIDLEFIDRAIMIEAYLKELHQFKRLAYPHSPIDGFQSNLCHHRHEDIKSNLAARSWVVVSLSSSRNGRV